ncbi:hypothetical protein [uncultured Chryseobacterium sp.]|uniref:hypothetical protein n=1 Tax=uncultured Chryseobacterium sp. TaxID=259322 RepID=UPI003748E741
MSLIYFLVIVFALANFFYFVYPESSKIGKRFLISLGIVITISIIISLLEGKSFIIEGIVTITGYYSFLFIVHWIIIKILRKNNYWIYHLLFLPMATFVTIFFTALMQDIFKYS